MNFIRKMRMEEHEALKEDRSYYGVALTIDNIHVPGIQLCFVSCSFTGLLKRKTQFLFRICIYTFHRVFSFEFLYFSNMNMRFSFRSIFPTTFH